MNRVECDELTFYIVTGSHCFVLVQGKVRIKVSKAKST